MRSVALVGLQQLQRDLAIELRIVRCIHDPHRTATHFLEHGEPTDHGPRRRAFSTRDAPTLRDGLGHPACGLFIGHPLRG